MKKSLRRTMLLSATCCSLLNATPGLAQEAAEKSAEGEPAEKSAEGQPAEKSAVGEPAEKSAVDEPAEKSAVDVPAEKPSKGKTVERIQVTGSRLKRSDVEGLSAIVKVDAETIKKSGMNTVSEVLKNMALSIDGSYSSYNMEDPRGTVTNANIRGVGANNTLVLLDGRRLPDEGGEGIVDLSQFPIAAIERIEVLKESASAIYGSDAAGGVLNIITKKDFEGNAVSFRTADPTGIGGTETGFSYVNGVQTDSFKVLTSLNYHHVEPVFWRDREWSKNGLSTYAIPGNIGLTTIHKDANGNPALNEDGSPTDTKFYPSTNCPADNPRLNGQCSFNFANYSAFSPELLQIGYLGNFDYRISDTLSFYGTLRAQNNTNLWNMAPNAGPFTIAATTLEANPEFNTSGGELVPGTAATVKYRAAAWGNRTWEEVNTTLGASAGLKGELSEEWEWNASFSHTESKKDSKSPEGFFLTAPVSDAIATGNFNPFETNLQDPQIVALVASTKYVPTAVNKTRMNTYDVSLTGDVFDLNGGKAGLAVGVNRFDQAYSLDIDTATENAEVFGVLDNKSASGDRTVTALYAELLMPFTKSFEVQLAARHDQYSDFGSTSNPKVGLKYKPISGMMFRANAGTGFKAPTLKQIHNAGSISYQNLYDTPNIASNPDRQDEVEIETYGSDNLKEETSFSWSAGFVVDPLDSVSITADYWYLRINDIITPIDPQRALDAAAVGTPLPGIEILHVNDAPNGPLRRIRVPTSNLGKAEDSGVDVLTQYRAQVEAVRFTLSNDYARKFYSRQVPFPGGDQVNYLGQRGHPSWRMVNTGTVGTRSHDLSLRNNIIAKQQKTSTAEKSGYMGSYSTYDAQYQWTHPWGGSVAVGVLNVTNKDFPKDDNERTGDDQRVEEIFNANGRMLYVNLNQTF